MGKLEHYRKTEQKYYNLIKLIADPYFLILYYEEIANKKQNNKQQQKKGNKSLGK